GAPRGRRHVDRHVPLPWQLHDARLLAVARARRVAIAAARRAILPGPQRPHFLNGALAMPSLTRLLAIVLVVAGLLAGLAVAVEPTPDSTTIRVHGKDFSSAVKIGDEVLEYRGGGLLKWFMWD